MDARRLVHAIGEGTVKAGGDPRVCERLLDALCSKSWLARSKKRAAPLLPKTGYRGVSGLSQKRAAAAAPERNEIMFDNIAAMYKELVDEGIMTRPEPLPEHVGTAYRQIFYNNIEIARFSLNRPSQYYLFVTV